MRHTLCVVTANHADVVRTRLAHEGLQDCIDTYFGSDRPGTKADHIREALTQYAVQPDRAWMVGDSISDIEAAHAGGVNSIAVSWGWQSGELLQNHNPDKLFNAPADMHNFFKTLTDSGPTEGV